MTTPGMNPLSELQFGQPQSQPQPMTIGVRLSQAAAMPGTGPYQGAPDLGWAQRMPGPVKTQTKRCGHPPHRLAVSERTASEVERCNV